MNKKNIKIAVVIIALLAITFFWREFSLFSKKDDSPKVVENIVNENNEEIKNEEEKEEKEKIEENEEVKEEKKDEEEIDKEKSEENKTKENIEIKTEKEEIKNEEKKKEEQNKNIVKKDSKKETKVEKKPVADKKNTVSISISAKTLLNNMDKLDKNKHGQVPENGIIYSAEVEVKDGDSVFDILQRVTRDNSIHLEASFTPIYKTNYIEGINNLYEFDAGELSGWMYSVNGKFPNYGASEIKVKAGDKIVWAYTCDLGEDIGGRNILEEVK